MQRNLSHPFIFTAFQRGTFDPSLFCLLRIAVHHAKVKPPTRGVLNMLKRLDKIRFRGQKRDDFLDLAESPNGSDNECSDDILLRTRPSLKTQDTEELGDPVSIHSTLLCSLTQMKDRE